MFDIPSLEDVPEDLRSRIKEVEDKSGFIPNIFLTLARRPAEWRAFFAYHDALMDKETPALSKGDRELIVVATSAENRCLYCVVAHGAIAGSGRATPGSPTRWPPTGAAPNSMTASV